VLGSVRRKKKLKQIKGTLYGVSIIKLPSGETQGSVPCWKKVTYIYGIKRKIVVSGFQNTEKGHQKSHALSLLGQALSQNTDGFQRIYGWLHQ
jgi:hypothetical protein